MKKVFQCISLSIFVLLVAACGSGEGNSTNSSPSTSEDTNTEDTSTVEKPVEQSKELTISLNEPIIVEDYAEITVQSNKFGKSITPPNPGSFYTYYENKEANEIYFDTVIIIKSLLTSKKMSDEFMGVKVIYDNKYEYTTFSAIEEDGGSDFSYTNITSIEPLKSATLHFLASLPEEIEMDGKPLKVIINIDGEEYVQTIR